MTTTYLKQKCESLSPPPQSKQPNGPPIDLSLLDAIEKSQTQNSIETLDLKTLKKLVLAFERHLKENLEARLKYSDNPDKFADSEIELHEEILKLKLLAGAADLYSDLVVLNTVPSIVGVMNLKFIGQNSQKNHIEISKVSFKNPQKSPCSSHKVEKLPWNNSQFSGLDFY